MTVLAPSTLYSVEEAYHSIIRVERERERDALPLLFDGVGGGGASGCVGDGAARVGSCVMKRPASLRNCGHRPTLCDCSYVDHCALQVAARPFLSVVPLSPHQMDPPLTMRRTLRIPHHSLLNRNLTESNLCYCDFVQLMSVFFVTSPLIFLKLSDVFIHHESRRWCCCC